MDVLIIGGTRFLGRHLVDTLLQNNHAVTLFNRGITAPELYPEVEKLLGDRDGSLHLLKDRKWDAVIDTCGYFPRVVSESAEVLLDKVEVYAFISTVSVYRDYLAINIDENYPVLRINDPIREEITGETYGPLKVLCEDVVNEKYKDRALIIRPGLIVGPHDPTDRFTYWPWRVALGGSVLVPESLDWETQVIDGRDLALWVVNMLESRKTGTYNAVGPASPLRFGELLDSCKLVSKSDSDWEIVDGKFLLDHKVTPWTDLPLWLFGDEYIGINKVSNKKAVEEGLNFRHIKNIIEDTLNFVNLRKERQMLKVGLSLEKEQELLNLWKTKLSEYK